jgi:hypothetical protein
MIIRPYKDLTIQGGWVGTFLWMPILGIVQWFRNGYELNLVFVLVLCVAALFLIFFLSPWRNPQQKMWKLMLPLYFILLEK